MNKLTRKQQRILVEMVALLAVFLLIITLSHINIISENNKLEAENNALKQENTSMKQEIDIKQSEITSLEWKLEECEKKQETHKMTK